MTQSKGSTSRGINHGIRAAHHLVPLRNTLLKELTDEEFDQFVAFASDKDFDHRSESQIEMERVVKAAKRENLYDLNVEVIEKLLDEVTLTKEEFLRHHKKHIKEALEQEICTKYYFQRGGAENILRYNEQMLKAIELWDDTILLPRQENGKN